MICTRGCELEHGDHGLLIPCATCVARYHASMARLIGSRGGHDDLAAQHRALAQQCSTAADEGGPRRGFRGYQDGAARRSIRTGSHAPRLPARRAASGSGGGR